MKKEMLVLVLIVLLFGISSCSASSTMVSVKSAGEVVSVTDRQDVSGSGFTFFSGDIEKIQTTTGIYYVGGLHSFSEIEEVYLVDYKVPDRYNKIVTCLQVNTNDSFSDNQCEDGLEVIK